MTDDDAALAAALTWLREGRPAALATVVETWGSSPRPLGSLLAATADGAFEGSVSGGCVEGAVVTECASVLRTGAAQLLDFGVSNEHAWEVGLACGGRLNVFIERIDDADLLEKLCKRRPLVRVIDLVSGDYAILGDDESAGTLSLSQGTLDLARQALAEGRSLRADTDGRALFVAVFDVPMRLMIVGAVHVAQVLAPIAKAAGLDVIVIDPRQTFASESRFPSTALRHDWPDEALADLAPDARTAVVTLSHDPKLDDPALMAALSSPAFYVGALGSRKTHAARRKRLSAAGFANRDVARIHGPVGLDLGGRAAPEIAVAILAEIIATRYGRTRSRRNDAL